MLIRRVLRAFEVRQVTEDNAIELAQWLVGEGRKLGAHDSHQPTVSWAWSSKPRLIINAEFDPRAATPGQWVGWGWPKITMEDDKVTPDLLVLDGDALVRAERYDQGFEEVRLG